MAALRALDLPPFAPRLPWLGSDLQTLRNLLRKLPRALDGGASIELPLGDDEALVGMIHRPAEERGAPLAILIHGLSGTADSEYVVSTARLLLAHGVPVLRLNLRGAGASQRTSGGRYHAGRSEDLVAVIRALPADLGARGLLLVGYSLGGNMLLKFLGERVETANVRGAVSVSAPADLAIASRRIRAPRNWVYHRHLLQSIKLEALAPTAQLTVSERQAITSARSIWAFDEHFIAPRHGFAGAEDYYAKCSAAAFVGRIEVPTLAIHALDDPWIPASAYRTVDWSALPAVRLALTRSGGHVGFHDAASPIPWHDRAILQFAEMFMARVGT
ncbi:MAG TPA: alpha/beta fold hydrolase [Aliidongia sp.]|nr:alpha/beta fold hydrolase [Aliidongia sp.]